MPYTPKQIKQIRENIEKYCQRGTAWGTFKVNHSESLEHNLKLAEQFVRLEYEHFGVAVRPVLLNGNKPDLLILNLKEPQTKEVMITETDERFESKDYMGLNKIKVK